MLAHSYRLAEWLMKLAYVNVLWLVFTAAGFVVFGIFPATAALFGVLRKQIIGMEGGSVTRQFWQLFKKEFWRSQKAGLILTAAAVMLYVDVQFLRGAGGLVSFLYYPVLLLGFAFSVTACYVMPVLVHYDTTVRHAFRIAFWLALLQPVSTILMMTGVTVWGFLLISVPGTIPFFSISGIAFVLMWAALLAFEKAEQKQKAVA